MDARIEDQTSDQLRARQDELRALGNVYAAAGDPAPVELALEFQRIADELARRYSALKS